MDNSEIITQTQAETRPTRRASRDQAAAIKSEVDYQKLNKSFTDVTFIVGPPQHSKKYVGHRVLLAMTSPVFEAMFYGDMADKNKYIRIADVAPIGFENLLRYAYTDSLNLASVEDAMLTAYAAKKYLLPQLLRECLLFIEHNISPPSACVVFEFAHVLNSQQLVLQAMNLIDRQTSAVIQSKSFPHVQPSTVEFLANRKYLALGSGGELSLFEALVSWAKAEARRRKLPADDWLTIRSLMATGGASILRAVRFLAMKPDEFARAVASTSEQLELAPADEETSSATPNGLSNKSPVELSETNRLLNDLEQRAVLLNLVLPDTCRLPTSLNPALEARQPPPDHFTLFRFRSAAGQLRDTNSQTTSTRNIKAISSKFQCLSENVFIVALTIPIRLDPSSYANRTPKFECHLKFTTRTTPSSAAQPLVMGAGGGSSVGSAAAAAAAVAAEQQALADDNQGAAPANGCPPGVGGPLDGSALLMDTIDESLSISIARDKDCLVRLKRPILIRMGNINELTLTFQSYALDEDIVNLQTPKLRSSNFSEQTDGENISWLFFKTSNVEFSELHYYY